MAETEDAPTWDGFTAPDLELIEELAQGAIAALPAPFREAAALVALRVADFASDAVIEEMGSLRWTGWTRSRRCRQRCCAPWPWLHARWVR